MIVQTQQDLTLNAFECQEQELKKKPEGETCKKWKAWRDADTGECYVQPADKEPRNGLDKFLLESSDCGALIAAVNKECGPKKDRRPEQPALNGPVPRAFLQVSLDDLREPLGWHHPRR